MDATKSNIFSLLNGQIQYLVPVYQRLYSWEIEQCQCLWDDILAMQNENREGHFLGSIVCIAEKTSPNGVQKYMVIDGQQRLTTLTLALIALRDTVKDDSGINKEEINISYLINQFKEGEEKYKLLLTEEDREVLIALIEKKPIPEGTVSKVLNSYNFFKSKIEKNELEPFKLSEAMGKLLIVLINLEREHDDPQAIFESLNSKGKKLSSSDLIRNFILMGLEKEPQKTLYNNIWRPMELLFGHDDAGEHMSWFFRDYLTMKIHRIPKIDNVYDEFKRWRLNNSSLGNTELCTELFGFAKIYTDVIFAKSSDSEFNSLYKQVNALNMGVVLPFLLFVVNDFNKHKDDENPKLTRDGLLEIIRLCISYVLRRSICEIPTNSLNKTFATLANEIKEDDYLNSIKAAFIKKDDYKVFPNDESFKKAFISKEIYKIRNRNYILDRLENYDNKTTSIIENMTIEHIMPQNDDLCEEWKKMLGDHWERVHTEYLHTIGNLTLTNYNSEMSDKPFLEKMEMKGGFKETNIRLNKYIVKQTEWTEKQIKERADLLFEKAKEIWEYPVLTKEELEPYIEKPTLEVEYTIESYHLNLVAKMLFENLDKRIMNLSPSVRREFKKLYVAYKIDTNFVDVVFNDRSLKLSIKLKFADVKDPKGICRDLTGIGQLGNGDIEICFSSLADLDNVMYIIKQAYEAQIQ